MKQNLDSSIQKTTNIDTKTTTFSAPMILAKVKYFVVTDDMLINIIQSYDNNTDNSSQARNINVPLLGFSYSKCNQKNCIVTIARKI